MKTMYLKSFLSLITVGLIGASAVFAADDFVAKKIIIESLISHSYTGSPTVNLTVSEKELKESWVPYANDLLNKEKKLEGSTIKNVELGNDGSVKVTAYLSSALKKSLKIPFISTVQVTARPTVENGTARISVTRLKAGYFPFSVALAQKILSKWNVNINNFVIKDKYFSFEKITVSDSELVVEGKYNTPIKAKFSCRGGQSIDAVFYKGSIKAILSDGRKFELPQTVSADGARFANSDESIVLWNKGDTLHFYDHQLEKGYINCKTLK